MFVVVDVFVIDDDDVVIDARRVFGSASVDGRGRRFVVFVVVN